MRTIEVEIDEAGQVHPVDSSSQLPTDRATLVGEAAEDWLRPEEDEVWAYLQPTE